MRISRRLGFPRDHAKIVLAVACMITCRGGPKVFFTARLRLAWASAWRPERADGCNNPASMDEAAHSEVSRTTRRFISYREIDSGNHARMEPTVPGFKNSGR